MYDLVLSIVLSGSYWYKAPREIAGGATCWRRYVNWDHLGAWGQAWETLLPMLELSTRRAWILNFLDCANVPRRRKHPSAFMLAQSAALEIEA